MTNHWNDIDNASMVLVMGANPAENHPACFAHINAARYGAKNAKLIVVDPRKTRTALQANRTGEFYVRIRPGTDIAFLNGMLRWLIANSLSGSAYNPQAAARLIDWHNGYAPTALSGTRPNPASTATRAFFDDPFNPRNLSSAELSGAYYDTAASGNFVSPAGNTPATLGWPKYCDSRLKVNAAGTDFQRGTLHANAGTWTFSNIPVVANSIDDPDTVFQKLRAHVDPYTPETVAGICGCTTEQLIAVAKAVLDNSRFASVDYGVSPSTPQKSDYKAVTFLYAMGQTQHTYGSQNIKGIAELQTFMGNMGRPGGGINALRGIHNVQGSTDMGVLFDSIPGYSGNPPTGTHDDDAEYIKYLDGLFGTRISGYYGRSSTVSGGVNALLQSDIAAGKLGLQQRGFHNMTQEWFGNGKVGASEMGKLYSLWPKGDGYQHIEALRRMSLPDTDANRIEAAVVWGQNPAVTEPNQDEVRKAFYNLDTMVVVDMFETETAAVDRKPGGVTYLIPACAHPEEAGSVTNSGRWIQWRERATAPKGNSKADVELMLQFAYYLDKANAFTHITGVWANDITTTSITGTAYDRLYKDKYGWSPADGAFEAISGSTERWAPGAAAPITGYAGVGSEIIAENVFKELNRPLRDVDNANYSTGGTMWIYSGNSPEAAWCTVKTGTSNTNFTTTTWAANGGDWQVSNRAKSRSQFSGPAGDNNALHYPRWGWSWLLNRRVFYNNGEVLGDRGDTFVSPAYLAYLFTIDTNDYADFAGALAYRKYKKFKDQPSTVAYQVDGKTPLDPTTPHWLRDLSTGQIVTSGGKAVSLAGRFSAHTEPIEAPNVDATGKIVKSTQTVPTLQAKWGVNTSYGTDLHFGNSTAYNKTSVGNPKDFPLVLTTIRCVEHFQGGPITRNNITNVETEPEPWIEINPIDARAAGIVNGDLVNVITARSNSAGPTANNLSRVDQQRGRSADGVLDPGPFAKGFRARVDNSISDYQRVAPGVVAIPWHWGDRGLSTGSRANDLCIDAWDANTMIPEYKACLCKIEKA